MTAREAIYETALEHIRDGHDMVCPVCGWMGCNADLEGSPEVFSLMRVCPACGDRPIKGYRHLAAYALAQAEKGEG